MPDLIAELTSLGHVARVGTLRARGIREPEIAAAVASGLVMRPRRGWVASPSADRDQLTAIAVGARLGCVSALRRFGVWSGVDRRLHLHVPRTASRLVPHPERLAATAVDGVWHPSVPERRRGDRTFRLASDAAPRVHWARELAPLRALDWVVSPQTALAAAVRCMDAEHASAAIDSALHEGMLTRRELSAVMASLPGLVGGLVDGFTGIPESGVESLFVRRMSRAGFDITPQFAFGGFRYDGLIDGCVLFEVDGRGFHSGSDEFFSDRDRTLLGQAFGTPVVRPSARHVLDDWPATFAAVAWLPPWPSRELQEESPMSMLHCARLAVRRHSVPALPTTAVPSGCRDGAYDAGAAGTDRAVDSRRGPR